jgi:MoxR-like ATPase
MSERLEEAAGLARQLREQVLVPVQRAFVGKDEVVDVLGVCLAAAEHAFLLGPPGTAKSALVSALAARLDGEVFHCLLTRFTEPSELFGPFDIRRLREGDLVTNTAGMLPEASLVFLDELWNANSAILNSLLTVLNERVLRRGREVRALPMLMAVGASNQLPEEETLGALFDRFLLRVNCENVPEERLGEVLRAGWLLGARGERPAAAMQAAEVARLQAAVDLVQLDDVQADLVQLVLRLRRTGLRVSDRRAVKMQRLVAASALLCGRSRAVTSDLWVFRHIWDTEEQREVLASQVSDALGPVAGMSSVHPAAHGGRPDPEALARELEALASQLPSPGDARQAAQWRDRLRALASRSEWVTAAEPRRLLGERVEELWKRVPLEC